MVRIWALGLALTAAQLVSGCAGTPADQPPSLVTEMAPPAEPATEAYELSKQELKYSCKKLTGVMQVRILQIRDYDPKKRASLAARGVQGIATPIWGGTTVGLDLEGQHRRDLAMLKAYNRRLAAKNCRTFDLAAELAGAGAEALPTPTKKAP